MTHCKYHHVLLLLNLKPELEHVNDCIFLLLQLDNYWGS